MKYTKYILLLLTLLLGLLVVGCTAKTMDDTAVDNTQDSMYEDLPSEGIMDDYQNNEADTDEIAINGDVILEIVGSHIDPDEIYLQKDIETTLVVYNKGEDMARFEIPMYGSQINIDIEGNQYEVVSITPQAVGITAMELNGNQVGRVVVE